MLSVIPDVGSSASEQLAAAENCCKLHTGATKLEGNTVDDSIVGCSIPLSPLSPCSVVITSLTLSSPSWTLSTSILSGDCPATGALSSWTAKSSPSETAGRSAPSAPTPVAQDLPQTVAATFSVEVATVAVTLMEGGFVGRLRVEWKVIINVPMTSTDLPSRDRLL